MYNAYNNDKVELSLDMQKLHRIIHLGARS